MEHLQSLTRALGRSRFSRLFVAALSLFCVACIQVTSASQIQHSTSTAALKIPLQVSISTLPEKDYTAQSFPLRVIFENIGVEDLSLLKTSSASNLDTFFRIEIKKPNGEYCSTAAISFEEFKASDFKYVVLKPEENFGVKLNLLELLSPSDNPASALQSGDYEISLTYSNKYGQNCFQGTVPALQSAKVHLSRGIPIKATK